MARCMETKRTGRDGEEDREWMMRYTEDRFLRLTTMQGPWNYSHPITVN